MYIYQHKDWPQFTWKAGAILNLLADVRNLQGKLLGFMQSLGFELNSEAVLEIITLDIRSSSAIEGVHLNKHQVRSSVARRLGLSLKTGIYTGREVEGVVEMMMDASQNYFDSLTAERLCFWHATMFPSGRSGMIAITVGDWRAGSKGPMQVVSGPIGKEEIHFEAPEARFVDTEMCQFMEWFNSPSDLDSVLKAALTHLWFITIHPFEDGNGRITRALTEMQLARSDKSTERFYSMSAQILKDCSSYYAILEKTQKENMDITEWIIWFLECLKKAILASEDVLSNVITKAKFWQYHRKTMLNNRQRKILNMLLTDFKGKLSTSKWAKICKCSTDTALRDIQDLIIKKILVREAAGGRSTAYRLTIGN